MESQSDHHFPQKFPFHSVIDGVGVVYAIQLEPEGFGNIPHRKSPDKYP
jgi:hypothetical protein